MAYDYETVELDSEIPVYASVETADAYLDGAYHADAWRGADVDDEVKSRLLVTATRLLDRQSWKGDKAADDNELQWPRTNTNVTGVEDDEIPTDIINASIEMALALLDGAETQAYQTAGERISSMSAGSVSISNFRSMSGEEALRFPLPVHELIRKYLAGSGAIFAATAAGVDTESTFPIEVGYGDAV